MDVFPHIPIINYHKVTTQLDIGITSRHPLQFERDMLALREEGYQTVTFYDLQNSQLPKKPIIITFDDGYDSVLEYALPRMQKVGFKGVVYVPTDFIGRVNNWDVQFFGKVFRHLSSDDLRFLRRQGFEIGSHGCSHRSLPDLPREEAIDEIRRSKQRLEEILQEKIVSISYPFGRFNAPLLRQVEQAGYLFGVASLYFATPVPKNHLMLPRFNVYRMDSSKAVLKKAQANFKSALGYRDWLIQKGSLATVWWQKRFKPLENN